MDTRHTEAIERFRSREKSRHPRRFVSLAEISTATLKGRPGSNERNVYAAILNAFDDVGFMGQRVLFLHPDVPPPFPHINSSFLQARISAYHSDAATSPDPLDIVSKAYVANCWVWVSASSEWFISGAYADGVTRKLSLPKAKRGPKFVYDWPAGRAYVFENFKKLKISNWDDFDSEYKSKAELIKEVADFYSDRSKNGEEVPSSTSLKERIDEWLAELVGNS